MGNRMLKDTIRTSRSVNALSDFQFRVWVYLITYVDDYGRGSADPELLKGLVFPRRKGITEAQIHNALEDLANSGMVNLYKVDGEPYFCFPNWSKHQRIQTQKSKFPGPEEATEIHGDSRKPTVTHGDSPPELETKPKPETETNLSVSNETDRRTDVQRVVDAWNATGATKVFRVSADTERGRKLKARIRDYGIDAVLQAIENVKNSDFLLGRTGKGTFQITFDWFVGPTNFQKVLEGNYNGTHSQQSKQASSNPFLDMLEDEYGQS